MASIVKRHQESALMKMLDIKEKCQGKDARQDGLVDVT